MTDGFPSKEGFGLTAQMRRAAISVPSNIAEGLTRKTSKDKLHFLNMAEASMSELDTQIEISYRLGYLGDEEHEKMESRLVEVEKLLGGLERSLR